MHTLYPFRYVSAASRASLRGAADFREARRIGSQRGQRTLADAALFVACNLLSACQVVHPIQRRFRLFASAAHEVGRVRNGPVDTAADVGGGVVDVVLLLEVVTRLPAYFEHDIEDVTPLVDVADAGDNGGPKMAADGTATRDAELPTDGLGQGGHEVRSDDA